jgi:outer membrane protein OmpA-like peptidoglycan-associated protein
MPTDEGDATSQATDSGEKRDTAASQGGEERTDPHQVSPRFEEIKILQSIIARHEDHSFRVKGWFAAIVGGLAAASYSKHIGVPWQEFAFLTFLIYAGLVIWLLYHRAIIQRAIGRVSKIEEDWEVEYRGSKVVETLSLPLGWWEVVGKKWDPQVHVPIFLGVIILIILSILVANNAEPNIIPPKPPNDPSGFGGGSGIDIPNLRMDSNSCDGIFIITLVLIILGAILVVWRRGFLPKAAGVLLLLSGLHFAVVKEFKFNIEKIIDKLTLNIGSSQITPPPTPSPPPSSAPKEPARFGAQYLGGIESFRTGRATIDTDGIDRLGAAKNELDKICKDWERRQDKENALVLVVGGTDRVPLAGLNRLRYEANTGLALARASSVRKYLTDNCWAEPSKSPDSKNVILLVSGPRNTPDGITERSPHGFPEDRRVDVWALTGISAGVITTAPAPVDKSQDKPTAHEGTTSGGSSSSF